MPAFDAIEVGQAMEALDVPITAALITGGAIATRDYFPGHIDLEAARALGSQGVFMNILTTNGLVGRYVTDWTGPGGFLKKVDIRLGAPNYPDDTMTLRGEVIETADDPADPTRGVVTVKLAGSNSIGDHVVGTVLVSLPREAS